jgi:predicted nucleic acid-binding protein
VNPPPLVRGLIHTDVLLDFRQGWPAPLHFISSMIPLKPDLTALSAMQLIANCATAADLTSLQYFFAGCEIHRVTAPISRRALALVESLPPPCGLTPDDAISAATAIEHSLPLYTLDPARFANVPGLAAVRPY